MTTSNRKEGPALPGLELEPWIHGHSPEAFSLGSFPREGRGHSGKAVGVTSTFHVKQF